MSGMPTLPRAALAVVRYRMQSVSNEGVQVDRCGTGSAQTVRYRTVYESVSRSIPLKWKTHYNTTQCPETGRCAVAKCPFPNSGTAGFHGSVRRSLRFSLGDTRWSADFLDRSARTSGIGRSGEEPVPPERGGWCGVRLLIHEHIPDVGSPSEPVRACRKFRFS